MYPAATPSRRSASSRSGSRRRCCWLRRSSSIQQALSQAPLTFFFAARPALALVLLAAAPFLLSLSHLLLLPLTAAAAAALSVPPLVSSLPEPPRGPLLLPRGSAAAAAAVDGICLVLGAPDCLAFAYAAPSATSPASSTHCAWCGCTASACCAVRPFALPLLHGPKIPAEDNVASVSTSKLVLCVRPQASLGKRLVSVCKKLAPKLRCFRTRHQVERRGQREREQKQ